MALCVRSTAAPIPVSYLTHSSAAVPDLPHSVDWYLDYNVFYVTGNSTIMANATAAMIPDSCVTDPTQANCTDFEYPVANAVSCLPLL